VGRLGLLQTGKGLPGLREQVLELSPNIVEGLIQAKAPGS